MATLLIPPTAKSAIVALAFFVAVAAGWNLSGLAEESCFDGQVVGVADGDTIDVLYQGRVRRVRLADIDCPEKWQPFGQKARAFTALRTFGKDVRIVVRSRDRYGRTVGDVILHDGTNLNRELVSRGLAWWYRKYSRNREIGRLQEKAMAEGMGLWSRSGAVAPWMFRKLKQGTGGQDSLLLTETQD